MGRLFDKIQRLVTNEQYVMGQHAAEQLDKRRILAWQVAEGLLGGRLLSERPRTRPNPTVEVDQILPDGTPYKAVWAYVALNDIAKLVTVHYYDQSKP